MKILILDDNEIIFSAPADYLVDPHDYRTDTVVQVAHPDLFWSEFGRNVWDEIWLDHDLGAESYSGRTVTKKLAEMGHGGWIFNGNFVVTTMNASAANNMVSDLSPYVMTSHCPISFLGDRGAARGDLIQDPKNTVLRRN